MGEKLCPFILIHAFIKVTHAFPQAISDAHTYVNALKHFTYKLQQSI